MNSGTSCLCLYYYYYSVMTFYTADRSDISAHAVLLSRLWSSWDGLAREHVDHDHHHRYQCHQLPSFCSAKLQLRKQRLSVNRCFPRYFPPLPYLLSSTSTASHSGLWELRKYVNYSSISAVAHCARMKERKEKMKKRKCFAEEVCTKQCVRVCVQAVPTYSLPSL